MTPTRSSQYINGADVLGSSRDATTGLVTLQLGDVVGRAADSQVAELWAPWGFASRPAKADAGKAAAQAFGVRMGSHDVVFAGRDSRSSTIYGSLADGESCFYAPGSQARVVCKADGSITQYTTDDNTPTGKGCSFQFSADGLKVIWPWGCLEFTKSGGLNITHGASKTQMTMGPISGLPGPLSDVGGTFCVVAPIASLKTSVVRLGAKATQNCAMNPAIVPSPAGAPGSTSVFIQP